MTVGLGSHVIVYDSNNNELLEFDLVEAQNANSLNNKISIDSPLGKTLIGKSRLEIAMVETPDGSDEYIILKVEGGKPVLKKSDPETKEFSYADIIVRSNLTQCSCSIQHHELMDIICKVPIVTPAGVIKTVMALGLNCKTCDRYYMSQSDYNDLRRQGVLLCKVVEESYYTHPSDGTASYSWSKESPLHILGYNVNKQINLTDIQRWIILERIVDEEVLSVSEICSYLEWFIERNTGRENLAEAKEKWKLDYDHIKSYIPGQTPKVTVRSMKIKRRKAKENK